MYDEHWLHLYVSALFNSPSFVKTEDYLRVLSMCKGLMLSGTDQSFSQMDVHKSKVQNININKT